MAKLALVRHGLSHWNKKGIWTGWQDVQLDPEGFAEARRNGEALKNIHFDYAFASDLTRSQETLQTIIEVLGYDIPTKIAPEIKERNYGDLTGKNKWQIKEDFGEEQFNKWRRGWDDVIPNGENLKMVFERAVPYYRENILPLLTSGKNVLVSAHGNSIRALAKFVENISDEDVERLEIGTGEAFIYDIDHSGKMFSKEVRASNENKV
jgi:2,3-bisphosphoglycerate-dependent phosphoglycerate mutase